MNVGVVATEDVVVLDGTSDLGKDILGGKAWGINQMRRLEIPVPPAFAATVQCCEDYYAAGRNLDGDLWTQIVAGVRELERQTGRTFGGSENPLLVSVRSGAATSMPGMMDTVLNLGINDEVQAVLAARGGDVYAADTRRRFLAQYRDVVLSDGDQIIPDDPWDQLKAAVAAVFDSWMSPRAIAYRKNRGMSDSGGTAVTVQAMVFGNLDDSSGTGVLFSRNPMTGETPAYGEWLVRGQGEDVVSGKVDPLPLDALRAAAPLIHDQLIGHSDRLEQIHRDIQDIEFTVESGHLWILQYRTAKRSARAAVKAAVTMAQEGLITRAEAVGRVDPAQVRTLLKPQLDVGGSGEPLFRGEPACPGITSGVVVIDADEAEDRGDNGEDIILARDTTSPDDLHGMLGARGIITELGGATSHAAVVSREIDRPCIVGCGAGTVTSLVGQVVTIDGEKGEVWAGALQLRPVDEDAVADFALLFEWASELAPLRVFRAGKGPTEARVADLDAAGTTWRDALSGAQGATGSGLQRPDVLRAAVEAGLDFIEADPALPALLTLLQVHNEMESNND